MEAFLPFEFLQKIRAQAERDYPQETCGILLGPRDHPGKVTELYPCRNVQDEYHARDPVSFPRTARTAYFIDPRELLQIQKVCRVKDQTMRVIYHSHVDAGAYFSEEDQRIALSEGRPVYPGVSYLVVSVKEGKAEEMALYRWEERTLNFSQAPVLLSKEKKG